MVCDQVSLLPFPSLGWSRRSRTCPPPVLDSPGLSDMNTELCLQQPNLGVGFGKGGNLTQPHPATPTTAARERMRHPDVTAAGSPSLTAPHKRDVPPWRGSSLLHFTFLAIHQSSKSRAGFGQALNKLLAEKKKIRVFFCWFENPAFGSLEEKESQCSSSALRQEEEPQAGIWAGSYHSTPQQNRALGYPNPSVLPAWQRNSAALSSLSADLPEKQSSDI